MTIFDEMTAELAARKDRSAWNRGVNAYALELVSELKERAAYEGRNPEPGKECRARMLYRAYQDGKAEGARYAQTEEVG